MKKTKAMVNICSDTEIIKKYTMKKHYNFYAVAKGRCAGMYSSWSECLSQVDGFKHNSFRGV